MLRAPGKVRLEERTGARVRRIGLAQHRFSDGLITTTIATVGGQVTVTIDGEIVLTGAFPAPRRGHVGLQVSRALLWVDDISIQGTP